MSPNQRNHTHTHTHILPTEPETSRFSEDELEVLEYAMAELQKVCVRDKQNALEP